MMGKLINLMLLNSILIILTIDICILKHGYKETDKLY